MFNTAIVKILSTYRFPRLRTLVFDTNSIGKTSPFWIPQTEGTPSSSDIIFSENMARIQYFNLHPDFAVNRPDNYLDAEERSKLRTTDTRPFSAALRASTLEVHDRANYSTYMRALLGGELTRDGYTQLAIQYYFIYDAIEAASDAMAGDPVGGEFVFDELRRLPNLERDLAHLVGPDWRSTITPLA